MAQTLYSVGGTGQTTNHYWGWGDNVYGQVGNGTNSLNSGSYDQYTPAGPLQFCTRCQRCIQLGTSNVFTAQCNGTLYLYFNGDLTGCNGIDFSNYGGSYTVWLTGAGLTNSPVTVWGTNYQGLAVGTVTVGNTYSCIATGYCVNAEQILADPNGKGTNGTLLECSVYFNNITNAVCPMWQCFSLVGKIQ